MSQDMCLQLTSKSLGIVPRKLILQNGATIDDQRLQYETAAAIHLRNIAQQSETAAQVSGVRLMHAEQNCGHMLHDAALEMSQLRHQLEER